MFFINKDNLELTFSQCKPPILRMPWLEFLQKLKNSTIKFKNCRIKNLEKNEQRPISVSSISQFIRQF